MAYDEEKAQYFYRYRGYLRLLAEGQLERKYARRIDASDMAQEALLRAWRDREQFRGSTSEEFRAWITRILANTIANATRDNRRMRRDLARERNIEVALGNSSHLMLDWLAAEDRSPSKELGRMEVLDRVADSLDSLSEGQRQAIVLRHWRGLSLQEIAARMQKTPGAVALLIHRGLTRLRERLKDLEQNDGS